MLEVVKDALIVIGIPIIRSISGWLKTSLEDAKITAFEWSQLLSTVLRVGLIGASMYFGLDSMGFDVDALGVAASAFLADMILSALKKNK